MPYVPPLCEYISLCPLAFLYQPSPAWPTLRLIKRLQYLIITQFYSCKSPLRTSFNCRLPLFLLHLSRYFIYFCIFNSTSFWNFVSINNYFRWILFFSLFLSLVLRFALNFTSHPCDGMWWNIAYEGRNNVIPLLFIVLNTICILCVHSFNESTTSVLQFFLKKSPGLCYDYYFTPMNYITNLNKNLYIESIYLSC